MVLCKKCTFHNWYDVTRKDVYDIIWRNMFQTRMYDITKKDT